MTGINTYSTTAANNVNANTGINWDEGMAPAAVNNSARQNMADIRVAFNDLIWFQYGKGDGAGAPTYSSGTIFTQASSVDLSAAYHGGRRVKAVGSSTGTIYGTISVTAFAASTQTVTVVWDSGSLSNEALTIYLSQIPMTGNPIPTVTGTFTPTDASGASLSFSSAEGFYSKIGDIVFVHGLVTFPSTANGTQAKIGTLPFTVKNEGSDYPLNTTCSNFAFATNGMFNHGATTFTIVQNVNLTGIPNSSLTLNTVYFAGTYKAAS